jgi:hypothetical protein
LTLENPQPIREADPSKMKINAKIFCGLPTYDGTRHNGSAMGMLYLSGVDTFEIGSSLLTTGFNRCYAEALNRREDRGITHFLLLHADIVPLETNWVQQLWYEFNKNKCQVLALAVPIKTTAGLTSTALDTDNVWQPRRITMSEMYQLPVTWSHPKLLLNTGMLLIDITQPWAEKLSFDMHTQIRKDETTGKFVVDTEPEDWHFSRQCHALGIPLHVTRRVRATHMGGGSWLNTQSWGQPTDPSATDEFDIEEFKKEIVVCQE